MTYIIVTGRDTVASEPFNSFSTALSEAERLFGNDAVRWMDLNIRIEENR